MNQDRDYQAEDLLADDLFISWIQAGKPNDDAFWPAWTTASQVHAEQARLAEEVILHLEVVPYTPLTDTEESDILNVIAQSKRKQAVIHRLDRRWLKIAAAVLLLISSAVFTYYHVRRQPEDKLVVQAVRTQLKENQTEHAILLQLPDGSSVTLKPRSELRYAIGLTGHLREVNLKGEAFFEIRHDVRRPFLVHSGDMVTQVLGTSFNVRTADFGRTFKVTVSTGKVSVYRKTAETTGIPVVLLPNEEVSYKPLTSTLAKATLSVPSPLSVQGSENRFNFRDVPLSSVVSRLEEAYGVKIVLDPSLSACPIFAALSTQPLPAKLDLICEAIGAHYTIEETHIHITGNGCKATSKDSL
jgi:transmembrane sensor